MKPQFRVREALESNFLPLARRWHSRGSSSRTETGHRRSAAKRVPHRCVRRRMSHVGHDRRCARVRSSQSEHPSNVRSMMKRTQKLFWQKFVRVVVHQESTTRSRLACTRFNDCDSTWVRLRLCLAGASVTAGSFMVENHRRRGVDTVVETGISPDGDYPGSPILRARMYGQSDMVRLQYLFENMLNNDRPIQERLPRLLRSLDLQILHQHKTKQSADSAWR